MHHLRMVEDTEIATGSGQAPTIFKRGYNNLMECFRSSSAFLARGIFFSFLFFLLFFLFKRVKPLCVTARPRNTQWHSFQPHCACVCKMLSIDRGLRGSLNSPFNFYETAGKLIEITRAGFPFATLFLPFTGEVSS